jgi:MDMPI C-terminal domain
VPEGDERRDWVSPLAQLLVQGLQATPPDTPVWTWYEPDRTAAFVARRCANELSIHRYDAQSARDACEPIDRAMAVDGIDEMVTRLVLTRDRTGQARGQTIHIHGTDSDAAGDDRPPAEWLVTLHPDRVDAVRQHAKGDLALRGSVSDLELLLYGRPTLGPVERLGDASVLDVWYREFSF